MSHWEPDKYPKVVRDSQRLKEYRSEWALAKVHPEEGLTRIKLREYLRTVTQDKWFTARFGTVAYAIQITRRRKTRASCKRRYPSRRKYLPPIYSLHFPDNDKNSRLLALHELCHILCYDQSHGPIYCSVLLQIVIRYMGVTVGRELRRQFWLHMVELVR